jgi:ABC-2 type transport system permease protein
MKALVQAELLKLRTVRTVGWTVAATLAFVPLSIVLAITRPDAANPGGLDSTEGFRNVIAGASSGGVLMILIGIIAMAGEFRFNTVTSVFLVTPDRRSVVGAKLASTALTGLAVGIASSLLTLAIALPWLSSRNVDVGSHVGDIVVVILGAVASTAIGGLVGVGIGSILTNQTLAITGTLVWIFVVETMLIAFVPGLGRWFPGATASAMSGVAPPGDTTSLSMWLAALCFAAYGLAFAAIGSRIIARRDIT